MLQLLIPKMYQHSIYTIDYSKLKKNHVTCLLFDVDNTCVGYHEKVPNQKLKKLFSSLKKQGFLVILFSNAPSKRLQPFCDMSVICHPSSRKPLQGNFKKILEKYHLDKENVCMIGDQLFTDIYGGNKVGIVTCLVDPVTDEDFIFTKIFRKMEMRVFTHFEKEGILKKGEYYD